MNPTENQDNYLHLGDLELQIMDIIWEREDYVSVSEIHEILYAKNKLAYTTIMTVMGNLHKKGVLKRIKEGKAYLYAPAKKRGEIAEKAINKLARMFYKDSAPEFFSCFLKSRKGMSREDIDVLRKQLEEYEEGEEQI
jgi:predicted transcriptional regulator